LEHLLHSSSIIDAMDDTTLVLDGTNHPTVSSVRPELSADANNANAVVAVAVAVESGRTLLQHALLVFEGSAMASHGAAAKLFELQHRRLVDGILHLANLETTEAAARDAMAEDEHSGRRIIIEMRHLVTSSAQQAAARANALLRELERRDQLLRLERVIEPRARQLVVVSNAEWRLRVLEDLIEPIGRSATEREGQGFARGQACVHRHGVAVIQGRTRGDRDDRERRPQRQRTAVSHRCCWYDRKPVACGEAAHAVTRTDTALRLCPAPAH
jgi:hypothetical protein